MEYRSERDNGSVVGVESDSRGDAPSPPAPLCSLARGVAAARATMADPSAGDPVDAGTGAAIKAADKWLGSKPVRSDLVILGRRVMEAAGLDDSDRTAADAAAINDATLAMTHARELITVAFVTGHNLGHEAGHRAGRSSAMVDEQVTQLSQAERRAASAAATRDASIRSELAEMFGLRPDASWTIILEALDTMKRAAKIVAHMFGGSR